MILLENNIMRSFKSVLFVIFVAALTVNLAGCKDDDDDKAASEKIAGTWYCEGFPEDIMVFNADGTGAYIRADEGINDAFTFSLDEKAGTLSILWSDGEAESWPVSIDGNRMYLYESDGIEPAEVYVRG